MRFNNINLTLCFSAIIWPEHFCDRFPLASASLSPPSLSLSLSLALSASVPNSPSLVRLLSLPLSQCVLFIPKAQPSQTQTVPLHRRRLSRPPSGSPRLHTSCPIFPCFQLTLSAAGEESSPSALSAPPQLLSVRHHHHLGPPLV